MRALTLLVVSAFALGITGCSSSTDEDSLGETGEAEQALRVCGTTKYNQALAHYRNAVDWSKERNRYGACGSENGLMWSIADEASRAVSKCGEFRSVIRRSAWAAPLRTALAPSLTLRSLSGELLVIKDSSWQNWSGVDAQFAKGISFWARAEGAYGARVRIDFAANGVATWNELVMDETSGEISLENDTATYSITKNGAASSSRRTVRVTHAGKTETFTLEVDNPVEYEAAPIFVLEPSGAATTSPKLYSLVSECDA